MNTPPNLVDIATSLKAGFRAGPGPAADALDALVSEDGFDLVHVPPSPTDGHTTKTRFREMAKVDSEGLVSAVRDYRYEDVRTERVGESVVLSYVMAGTLPSGEELNAPVRMLLEFRDGYIARMQAQADSSALADVISDLAGPQHD